jgi:hypothetical protein
MEAQTNFKTTFDTVLTNAVSPKSPNVPFGNYEFVANAAGDDVLIDKSVNKAKTDYVEHYVIHTAGAPDSRRRRVYLGAITSPEAKATLFDATTGEMKRSASFGIYQDADGNSVFSTDKDVVTKGIAEAQESYAASLKAKPVLEASAVA